MTRKPPFQFSLAWPFIVMAGVAVWSAIWGWLPWDVHLIAAAPILVVAVIPAIYLACSARGLKP
jgi:hypothetical protein